MMLRRPVSQGLALFAALLVATFNTQAAEIECHKNASGTRFITYVGQVDHKDAELFRSVFGRCYDANYRGSMHVLLESPGGVVTEGLGIANFIVEQGRRRGPITVRVPKDSYCISACTYIFVAGNFRQVDPGASLEPHGFSAYSGQRIDRVMVRAAQLAQSEPDKLPALKREVKILRLIFLSTVLQDFVRTEQRFSWLAPFLVAVEQYSRKDYVELLLRLFAELNGDQRRLVAELDSIVNLVVTEIERDAALTAFKPHLDEMAGRPRTANVAPVTGREDNYARWMSTEFLAAFNRYLARSKGGSPLRDLGPVTAAIAAAQGERIRDTMSTVDRQLWPYLQTRGNDVELEGFVRLMFSTSILYTRPLTREELCDLNLVNGGCN